jgi:hypothetical protein
MGQYTRFAGVESEPEGNCHFAGEHTSLDYQADAGSPGSSAWFVPRPQQHRKK